MKVSTKSTAPGRSDATGRAGVWARLLGISAAALLLVAPLVAAGGWVMGGHRIALSALAGVILTAAFLLAGLMGLRLVLGAHEALVLPGVMGILGFQLLALMALWTESRNGTVLLDIDAGAFGAGALTAAVVWQVALVAALTHTRQLVYADAPTKGAES